MGVERLSFNSKDISSHDRFRVLTQYLNDYHHRLSGQQSTAIKEDALKFAKDGKYMPQLDKDDQPIVDPSCIRTKGALTVDYTCYDNINSIDDLDTKHLTVTRKCNRDMYQIYVKIANEDKNKKDSDDDTENTIKI